MKTMSIFSDDYISPLKAIIIGTIISVLMLLIALWTILPREAWTLTLIAAIVVLAIAIALSVIGAILFIAGMAGDDYCGKIGAAILLIVVILFAISVFVLYH